ncbi:MAG: hypothetical protein HC892_22910 [Saprospiraceae bacterium]|nr:hypothetical protein [Saprospiraceae bacterium]
MAKRILVSLVFLVTLLTTGFAQNDDPTLFTVHKTNVRQSEFEYIYSKTNGKQADFSKASLEEYLDLYVKFKLKVEKAKSDETGYHRYTPKRVGRLSSAVG